MLTALKWSGTSVTVGSLVAATTVRVIAGGAGVVCAVPEAGSAIAPSNSSPVVLNCMIASQVQRIIGAPYALPAPLGMAGRFQLLLDGNREQRAVESDSSWHFAGAQCDRADPLDHGQNSPVLFPRAVCSRRSEQSRVRDVQADRRPMDRLGQE